jgi:hypothetical protein
LAQGTIYLNGFYNLCIWPFLGWCHWIL